MSEVPSYMKDYIDALEDEKTTGVYIQFSNSNIRKWSRHPFPNAQGFIPQSFIDRVSTGSQGTITPPTNVKPE